MLKRIVIVAMLTVASLVAVAGPVAAKDGDIIRRGQCTGASTWKLKLSLENGRGRREARPCPGRRDAGPRSAPGLRPGRSAGGGGQASSPARYAVRNSMP